MRHAEGWRQLDSLDSGGEVLSALHQPQAQQETKYSTTEKECLAIKWMIRTLWSYMPGQLFTLCSMLQ